jgi:hypothetical protein
MRVVEGFEMFLQLKRGLELDGHVSETVSVSEE